VFPKLLLLTGLFNVLLTANACAQEYLLTGKITNTKLEPLPFASVRVKELQTGTLSDKEGNFKLQLQPGKYDLVVSMLGFKTQVLTVVITKNYQQQILMEEEDGKLLGVVEVVGIKKDKAEEYIRNVIRNKDKILQNTRTYSCNVYIKATDENNFSKKKKSKDTAVIQKSPVAAMNLTEVYLKLDYAYPGKIKEERTGVKVRGNRDGLFYLTTTDGDFNFYNNLVQLPALAKIPMLSPVSYSGLVAYKYKTIKVRKQYGRTIYTIKITPAKLGNALVSGELDIMDSAWVILRTHFEMPKFHLVEYDFFSVDQQYEQVNNAAWMPVRQEFNYLTKTGKAKQSGRTVAVFSDYNVDTSFAKKHFGTEISSTAQQAYERDSSFWKTVRKEPLTEKEVRFIQYRDSVVRAHTTTAYLDSVDRYNNKITLKKLFLNGVTHNNWRKERFMHFPTIPEFYQPLQFGGTRIATNFYLSKRYKSRKNITLRTELSYGIRNKDLQGTVAFSKLYNPFSRGTYWVSAGRSFGQIFEGDAWINQLKRSNVFLKEGVEFSHSVELANGLVLRNRFELTGRKSVAGYQTNDKVDSLFGTALTNNQAVYFPSYNAFYNTIGLDFTPRQKYIREPKEKVILGSSWPTFSVTWRKGVKGLLNSAIDFDYLEYGISQRLKMGLAGEANYSFITGTFVSKKDLRLVDYKFLRQGDPLLFSNPTKSFQALDSSFPVFKRFYEGHYLHQFHGAIINKIPVLKKLNLLEVAGGGVLYVPERNLKYAEVFLGIEKIIRFWRERYKIGTYIVGSVANQFKNPIQFKISIEQFNRRKNSWY
jgi:Family of unknown function (DUF5686)/CarboxypepD_reg-like domain